MAYTLSSNAPRLSGMRLPADRALKPPPVRRTSRGAPAKTAGPDGRPGRGNRAPSEVVGS
ncbi:hypothetical protein GCM10010495_65020 [Kitasatospora herbaricolor]|nr:hypothetical protein GCM10010495_65020 [Kitasatospora herbaricolor]